MAREIGTAGPVLAFIDESVVGVAMSVDGSWTVEPLLQAASDPFQIVGLALDSDGAPHLTFSRITATGPLAGEIGYVEPLSKQ
jgi:hypothetical protein